uniref:Uncharacterized protein n=1 Tax=Setaria viridis TaxID=4556 RepID=A0A4U6TQA3_SETVI|nr:hypothetical protein SEVIR_7G006200v2 [Setaria viridis]
MPTPGHLAATGCRYSSTRVTQAEGQGSAPSTPEVRPAPTPGARPQSPAGSGPRQAIRSACPPWPVGLLLPDNERARSWGQNVLLLLLVVFLLLILIVVVIRHDLAPPPPLELLGGLLFLPHRLIVLTPLLLLGEEVVLLPPLCVLWHWRARVHDPAHVALQTRKLRVRATDQEMQKRRTRARSHHQLDEILVWAHQRVTEHRVIGVLVVQRLPNSLPDLGVGKCASRKDGALGRRTGNHVGKRANLEHQQRHPPSVRRPFLMWPSAREVPKLEHVQDSIAKGRKARQWRAREAATLGEGRRTVHKKAKGAREGEKVREQVRAEPARQTTRLIGGRVGSERGGLVAVNAAPESVRMICCRKTSPPLSFHGPAPSATSPPKERACTTSSTSGPRPTNR